MDDKTLVEADWQKAVAKVNLLQRELDITNADHIALWIEANTIPDEPMSQCASWLAVQIVEAHERALSLMQPEIDRRVAEEKAKLLERLREPSETMIEAGVDRTQHFDLEPHLARGIWQAMLAQYEKDNSDG